MWYWYIETGLSPKDPAHVAARRLCEDLNAQTQHMLEDECTQILSAIDMGQRERYALTVRSIEVME